MHISVERLKSTEIDLKRHVSSFEKPELVDEFIQIANKRLYFKSIGNYFKRDYQTVVKLYAIFHKIIEIDNVREQYKANVYIEASWEDNSVTDNIFDLNKYWTPQIYIENAVGKLKQDIKYKIERRFKKTIVHEIRNIESIFWEKLELSDFPIDIQDLGIEITSERSINEIRFETDTENESLINKETFQMQQEWNLYSTINTEKSNFNDVWKEYERPVFKINCKVSRKPGYYINNAFLLIFFMTVLGFISFSIDVQKPNYRISVVLTLILSSTNFRWVVTQRLPSLSYLTRLDKYALSGIIFLVLLCCWHAIVGSPLFENNDTMRSAIDNIIFYIVVSLFVGFHVVYILVFLQTYAKYEKIDCINNKIKPLESFK